MSLSQNGCPLAFFRLEPDRGPLCKEHDVSGAPVTFHMNWRVGRPPIFGGLFFVSRHELSKGLLSPPYRLGVVGFSVTSGHHQPARQSLCLTAATEPVPDSCDRACA